VATGDDGKLHRFNTKTLAAGKSVLVGDDADNVMLPYRGLRIDRPKCVSIAFPNTPINLHEGTRTNR
jgi:hypothetical protein